MSELQDLFAIYAQVDQKVRDDPSLAQYVAPLLPVYANPDPSVFWSEDFARQTRVIVEERGGKAEPGFGALEDAVQRLGQATTRLSMRARRLFAVGVAFQLGPRVTGPELVQAAIGPGIGAMEEEDLRVHAFVEALRIDQSALMAMTYETSASAEPESFDIEVWWQRLVGTTVEEGLVESAAVIGPRPCSGGLTWVDLGGNREPAVTLATEFETDLAFDAVLSFLKPETWPCFEFWCSMVPDPNNPYDGGIHKYHEVVSLDKHHPNDTWTVEVDLDFTFDHHAVDYEPRLAIAEYRLSAQQPQPQRVLVNEGSLVVSQANPASKVKVKTTKRLKFNSTFDGPSFASVLCRVGYLSYLEDLVCCAAEEAAGGQEPSEFPGQTPPDSGLKKPQQEQKGAARDFRGLTGATITRVADAVEDCIDDWASLATGSCKADKPASQVDKTLTRPAIRIPSGPARVADFGFRAAGLRPSRARPARSEDPPSRPPGADPGCTPMAEVVEDYAELGKLLVRSWRDYGKRVAQRFDAGGYDADTAVGDWASAIWLAVESGARLGWEAVDAANILGGRRVWSTTIDSDEFTSPLQGATLSFKAGLESGFRYKPPSGAIRIDPGQLGAGETAFKLCANTAGCHAGTYGGTVVASLSTGERQDVSVWITIP